MPLSPITLKNAKPKDKPDKLSVEKGIYVQVNPNVGKYFRQDYRFDGKRQTLALGTYPVTSLEEASEKVFFAEKQIKQGINASVHKQSSKPKLKARRIALKLLQKNG